MATENRSLRVNLISANNFSFADLLTMEVVNQKIVGRIDEKYKTAANAFQLLGEFKYLNLSRTKGDKDSKFTEL